MNRDTSKCLPRQTDPGTCTDLDHNHRHGSEETALTIVDFAEASDRIRALTISEVAARLTEAFPGWTDELAEEQAHLWMHGIEETVDDDITLDVIQAAISGLDFEEVLEEDR